MMQVLFPFELLEPNKGKDDLPPLLLRLKLLLPPPRWQWLSMINKAITTNTIRYLVFIYY